MAIVTIKPKPGSRKFKAMQGMQTFHTVTSDGGKTHQEVQSEFRGERFPNSKQMFRPIYSSTKRKWMLEGFEENSKELNKLVAECKLKHRNDSLKRGEYIVEADLYDFNDPFFTHKMCRLMATEGEILLDTNRAMDKLMLAALKKNRIFQVGANGNNYQGRAKYVITDKELDNVDKKKLRTKKLKAMGFFESLTDKKKEKIATILEIIPPGNTDRELIDDVLFRYAENDVENAVGSTIKKQDLFITLCELTSEDLSLDYEIAKAKSLGILKLNQNGFLLFGNPVGKSKEAVKQYLLSEDNQETLLRLQEALSDKIN